MSEQQARVLIGLIGLYTQLGITLLTVGLFAVLKRPGWRRSYFTIWGQAFAALLVAIAAIVLRYLEVGPAANDSSTTRLDQPVAAFVYQGAKFVYFFLLAAGAARYTRGLDADRMRRWGLVAAAAVTIVSFSLSASVSALVAWQSPIAILCGLYAAYALLRLPAARRSTGSRVTGAAFAGLSALWVIYFAARTGAAAPFGEAATDVALFITRYNPYFDILAQTILAFGMVVLHMEDARHEADDARAQLAVANDELRRLALHDALTSCLNRRAFTEGIGLELAKSTFGSVVMLDLDNLKRVNDEQGHAAGDHLLTSFARELRARIRPNDRLYRWGGDEFLLVLPGAELSGVRARLEATIAAMPHFPWSDGSALAAEVSFGAAAYECGDDLHPAIGRADAEMYVQKRGRKARLHRSDELPVPAAADPRGG